MVGALFCLGAAAGWAAGAGVEPAAGVVEAAYVGGSWLLAYTPVNSYKLATRAKISSVQTTLLEDIMNKLQIY